MKSKRIFSRKETFLKRDNDDKCNQKKLNRKEFFIEKKLTIKRNSKKFLKKRDLNILFFFKCQSQSQSHFSLLLLFLV